MTVDQLYSFLKFIARKNQTGSITPTEFETVYNSSQRTFFDTLLGKITIAPHVALGQNERIAERLRPFKTTEQQLIVTAQIATYPTGFQAITDMTDVVTGKSIQYLDDNKLRKRLQSAIDPIEQANPAVFTNTKTGWKIWPNTIATVFVSYYKMPTPVKWGFIPDDNGRPVYNSATSTDPLWDDVSNEEILARCCTQLGISFQSQNLVQFGQAAKLQGA